MKLTVIGSMGAYPAADNPSSGYLLQHDGFSMMLDIGSAVLINLQKYIDVNELDAVFLSHYHPDHTTDIGVLQHAVKVQTDLGNRDAVMPIYGQAGKPFFEKLTYHNYTERRAVSSYEPVLIGPFSCEFLDNPHPDGGLSIKLSAGGRKLVYTGDTGWNDALVDFASGCDLLLCEASLFNRFAGMVEGHLTAGEVGRLAREADVGHLALCHFPHFGSSEELLAEVTEEFKGKANNALPTVVYNLT
ncbi:MAG TPA: hypothetical protein DCO79_12215 [Spirochaeta sp.]|nr:hypothetical protein [Spirochaeta sp.]